MVERVRATLQEGKFKPLEHLIERLMEEGFQSTEIAAAALHLLQADGGGSAPRVAESRAAEPEPPRGRPEPRPQQRWGDEGRREYPRQERGYGDRQERSYGDRPEPRQALTRTPREPLRAAYSRPAPYERPVRPAKPAARVEPSPAPAPRAAEPVSTPAETPAPKVVAAPEPAPAAEETPRRHAPRTGGGFTRLWMNIGAEMGVGPNDIVGAILGETGLPAKVVGQIDLRDRHVFVDVAADAANAILAKIKRTMIKGHRVKAKVA
jgi:ATP-dependent RNA helicase DeaD